MGQSVCQKREICGRVGVAGISSTHSPTYLQSTCECISSGEMGVFDGCQVTLELDSSVRFKEKLGLKKKVIDHGGIISFIVTKKVRIYSCYYKCNSNCICIL